MALTFYQHANQKKDGGAFYPHSKNFPGFFSASSTFAPIKYDFYYIFRVKNHTGQIFETYVSPNRDNVGYFNVSPVIKPLIGIDLKQESGATNYYQEYRVTCQEFFDGEEQGSEIEYNKTVGGNLDYNYFDAILPYTLEENMFGKFFTNYNPNYIYNSTLATKGYWITSRNSVNVMKIRCKMQLSDGDFVSWLYEIDITPAYNFNPSESTIYDASELSVSLPIGYESLSTQEVTRLGFYDEPSGNWHSDYLTGQTGINTQITQQFKMNEMQIYLTDSLQNKYEFRYPKADFGGDCTKNNITMVWKNTYGGSEFFNFPMVRKDFIENEQKVFLHNSFETQDNAYYTDTTRSNYSVYSKERSYNLNIKTDLLHKGEIELLKSLWWSDQIGMYIDGIYYPIISLSQNQEIPSKDRPELVSYQFDIQYAKIN